MMYVAIALIGLVIGYVGGVLMACYGQLTIEKKSTETGVIKLDGEYYRIEKITQVNNNEN